MNGVRRTGDASESSVWLPGRNSAGFTLIEIMVVISIIIIAFGFLVPSIMDFMRDRALNSAGTMVTMTLNEARDDAVTQRRPFAVVFLRRGMQIYDVKGFKLPGKDDVIHIAKGMNQYASNDHITYYLHFVKETFDYNEIPETLSDPTALTDKDIYILFLPDGTVDFRQYHDVPTFKYEETPPVDADIIIAQRESTRKGYIDIRPAGTIAYKAEDDRKLTE